MRCWSWLPWGAQVLHNRSVEMAKKYNVKLEVLSSFTGHPGTKVKEVAKRMEKSYISSVAKNVNIARIALIGVPNEIGTSFKVFSLLAQNHINVDIILQGIGHEEGKDICFTVAQSDLEAASVLLKEHSGVHWLWPSGDQQPYCQGFPWWERA